MNKFILLLVVFLIISACQEAELLNPNIYECDLTLPELDVHPKSTAYQSILEDIIPYTPGVQVAIRDKQGLQWTGAAGYADIPNNIMMQPCHHLMVGSVSKIVTSTLIYQLQDEGLLDINDPLSKHLSDDLIGEIENADKVNITHLLNHTSGIRDYLSVEQFFNSVNQAFFKETQREKLKYIYGKSAYHEPDAEFTYSNTNYVLLGIIVEEIRQMTLWDAVEEFIAVPLGLSRLVMGSEENPIPEGTARPYLSTRGDKYYDIMQNAVSDAATGDGGIASNAQDLVLFIEGLFNGQLISEAALNQMIENVVPMEDESDFDDWGGDFYGLGITRYNTDKGVAYGHTGLTSSYSSVLFYFPESRTTFAVAYNGANFNAAEGKRKALREAIFELIFEE